MRPVTVPRSPVEPVTDVLHGVAVTDPYRWLEDANSPETRAWIEAQQTYARDYLNRIPGREHIFQRVRGLLDVETYDSVCKAGTRYFFRKRLPGQEQPCIYFREGADGSDELLVDPSQRGTGRYTAVKPLRPSWNGRLLLYQVKHGGERPGIFEILDVASRTALPDALPYGYLRGFAFAQDTRSFYYSHESKGAKRSNHRAAYHHVLGQGQRLDEDREVFCAGDGDEIRLGLVAGNGQLGFLVHRLLEKTYTDFYHWQTDTDTIPKAILRNVDYIFGPKFLDDAIFAITNLGAPNFRIVKLSAGAHGRIEFVPIIAERNCAIRDWHIVGDRIFVSYASAAGTAIHIFDLLGKCLDEISDSNRCTVRLVSNATDHERIFLERESFFRPIEITWYSRETRETHAWATRNVRFSSGDFDYFESSFSATDGVELPIFLAGHRRLLKEGSHPIVMTAYGGHGVSVTPQFSVLVAFLVEQGCLFALPRIRGGSEFGEQWHNAARRRNRQVAFDDFIGAAEWLVRTGRTEPGRLSIFGGSNSGLLVGAALTQRPDLFRAVLCMVPMLDMLRYHRFDDAHVWKEEFGTADDPEDFAALLKYSPYHAVRKGQAYPATLIVSGDADGNCNPLHARKMAASLQAANTSNYPILLDYHKLRGHSPVLPLSVRIEALTDRIAFLCEQLGLEVNPEGSSCFV
jgi:prolyl oligopeptidase